MPRKVELKGLKGKHSAFEVGWEQAMSFDNRGEHELRGAGELRRLHAVRSAKAAKPEGGPGNASE